MAIIYSYPTVAPAKTDLVLGTDVSANGQPTKNFSIQGIIDLVTVATGDLQTVLDLGEIAIGKDIVLGTRVIPTQTMYAGTFTTGSAIIAGGVGTGFTDFTSTRITGTIQAASAAQPNITSLGNLTALVIDGAVSGTNVITSTTLVGASNTNIVSTLAIKTYVDSNPAGAESLAATLLIGETTSGTDIVVSAGDDITFTDTSKILMGTTAVDNFEIYSDSLNSIVIDRSPGALKLQTSLLSVKNEADTETILSGTAGAAVDLYFNNVKKFETLTGGAKVTGAFEATGSGTFVNLLNTGTYSDSSGDVGTAGQILSSTASGTNWVTELPLYTWSYEGTNIPSATAMTVTDGTNITTTWNAATFDLTIATTGVPAGTGAQYQVTYWDPANALTGAAGFTFAGGATGQVTVAGILQAGTLSDGTFSGTAGTYTGGVSISSTTFIGALTGNASTATALAASGQIQLSGDTTSALAYTYTSGGAINIATSIADTVVTGKVLTGLSTATAQTIVATDTILEAFGYLQSTITGLPSGLDYIGTWDARTVAEGGGSDGGTPDLRTAGLQVPGHYYIVATAGSATPNGAATTPDEWKIGDWVMRADATISEWQKIDNTSTIDGTGTANKIARWTGTQTLGTGLIDDDGSTVTIGNTGALIVEGNTTLGNAVSDTVLVKGPATFEAAPIIELGIGLGAVPAYGTAGDVLTSGGSATVNSWTTPTTGTVTSVALTETGSALTITGSPITSSGTLNIAGAGTAAQYINGALDLVTFPTLDNYVSWTLAGDTGVSQTISSTNTATFAGGFGISTVASATDTLTTAIDITGTDNAIAGLTAATPVATDTLWFNDISDSNTIRKATIADIVDLGNETLAQVLSNGNTTGGLNIAVSAGDDITFTDTSQAIFGSSSDFLIYHDGLNASYIVNSNTLLPLQVLSNDFQVRSHTGSENMILANVNSSVELYYDAVKKFETTSAGVTVTGDVTIDNASSVSKLTIEAGIPSSVTGQAYIDLISRSSGSGTSPIARIVGIFEDSNDSAITLSTTEGGALAEKMRIKSTGAIQFNNYGSGTHTGTEAYTLGVDSSGNIIETLSSGGGGGIFYGSKTFTAGAAASNLFTLTRANTGTLVFDVWLTSGDSSAESICKRYTVARAHAVTTTVPYNKLIDSGPDGSNDFTVSFLGDATTAVECKIAATGADQTVSYTVQVGYDSVNALTVA